MTMMIVCVCLTQPLLSNLHPRYFRLFSCRSSAKTWFICQKIKIPNVSCRCFIFRRSRMNVWMVCDRARGHSSLGVSCLRTLVLVVWQRQQLRPASGPSMSMCGANVVLFKKQPSSDEEGRVSQRESDVHARSRHLAGVKHIHIRPPDYVHIYNDEVFRETSVCVEEHSWTGLTVTKQDAGRTEHENMRRKVSLSAEADPTGVRSGAEVFSDPAHRQKK